MSRPLAGAILHRFTYSREPRNKSITELKKIVTKITEQLFIQL